MIWKINDGQILSGIVEADSMIEAIKKFTDVTYRKRPILSESEFEWKKKFQSNITSIKLIGSLEE